MQQYLICNPSPKIRPSAVKPKARSKRSTRSTRIDAAASGSSLRHSRPPIKHKWDMRSRPERQVAHHRRAVPPRPRAQGDSWILEAAKMDEALAWATKAAIAAMCREVPLASF